MTKVNRRSISVCAPLVAALFVGSSITAEAKPKTTRPKKKPKVTTTVTSKQTKPTTSVQGSGSVKRFSCQGSGGLPLNERIVTGTVSSNIIVTDVTVTKTHQFIDGEIVAQPLVDLVSTNPPVERSPILEFDSFELNRLPAVTAADAGEIMSVYKLNVPKVLPAGPKLKIGLFFDTWKATQTQWDIIASVAVTGAYEMDCSYV
jgi:hypothetical protein